LKSTTQLLPNDTLVDVVATHLVTGEKSVKKMSLEEYYKLKNKHFHYQAYQVGFLNLKYYETINN